MLSRGQKRNPPPMSIPLNRLRFGHRDRQAGRLIHFRGSSALRSCPLSGAVFTTMASADSSFSLENEASPGKVYELSTRALSFYLIRLSVTVGFRVSSHTHRPYKAYKPFVFLEPCLRYRLPSASCLAATALSFTTFVVTISRLLPFK